MHMIHESFPFHLSPAQLSWNLLCIMGWLHHHQFIMLILLEHTRRLKPKLDYSIGARVDLPRLLTHNLVPQDIMVILHGWSNCLGSLPVAHKLEKRTTIPNTTGGIQ
jgi:hypothetical protein